MNILCTQRRFKSKAAGIEVVLCVLSGAEAREPGSADKTGTCYLVRESTGPLSPQHDCQSAGRIVEDWAKRGQLPDILNVTYAISSTLLMPTA